MSTHSMREHGQRLARRLSSLHDDAPFILAIPRGGVLAADALARALHAPFDVLVAAKVYAGPSQTAIAAIAEGGAQVIDEHAVAALGLAPEDVDALIDRARAQLSERLEHLRGAWPLPALIDRTVVLVDDAVVSGLTMRAAIAAVRMRGVRKIVVATPLCASDVPALLAGAREIVALETLPALAAARVHADPGRAPCPPITDTEVHDLVARELRDVGIDPFGGLTIDGV